MLIKRKFVFLSLTILLLETLTVCVHAKSLPINKGHNGSRNNMKSKTQRIKRNISRNEPILHTISKPITHKQISSQSPDNLGEPFMNDVEYNLRLRQLMEELVLRGPSENQHDITTEQYPETKYTQASNKHNPNPFSHNQQISVQNSNKTQEPQQISEIKDSLFDYVLFDFMSKTKNLTKIVKGNATSSADGQKIRQQLEFLQKNADKFKRFQQVQERTKNVTSQTLLSNLKDMESFFNNQSSILNSEQIIQNNSNSNYTENLNQISLTQHSNITHGNDLKNTTQIPQVIQALTNTKHNNISDELPGPTHNYSAPISLEEFLNTINLNKNINVDEKSSSSTEIKMPNHMNNFESIKNDENITMLKPNKGENFSDLILTKQNMESITKKNIVTTEINLERSANDSSTDNIQDSSTNYQNISNETLFESVSHKYLEIKNNIPLHPELDIKRNIPPKHIVISMKDSTKSNHLEENYIGSFIEDDKPNNSSDFEIQTNLSSQKYLNTTRNLDHLKTTNSSQNIIESIFDTTENSTSSSHRSKDEHLISDIAPTNTIIEKHNLTHSANTKITSDQIEDVILKIPKDRVDINTSNYLVHKVKSTTNEPEDELIIPKQNNTSVIKLKANEYQVDFSKGTDQIKSIKEIQNNSTVSTLNYYQNEDLTTETPYNDDTTLNFQDGEHFEFAVPEETTKIYENYLNTESPENIIEGIEILKKNLNSSNKINSEENYQNQLVTENILTTESSYDATYLERTEMSTTPNFDGVINEGVDHTDIYYKSDTPNSKKTLDKVMEHINNKINNTNTMENNINHTSNHIDFRNNGIMENETEVFFENQSNGILIDQTTKVPYHGQPLSNEMEYIFNESSVLQDRITQQPITIDIFNPVTDENFSSELSVESSEFKILDTEKEQNLLTNNIENLGYKNADINTEDPNIKILSLTSSAYNQTTQSMNNVSPIGIIDNVDYSNEIDYYEHQDTETDMDKRQSDESSHEEDYNESTTTESLQETTTNDLPITTEQIGFTTELSNTSSKNMSTEMDLDIVVPYSNTNILNSLETITNKNSSINMNYADNSPAIAAFENTHNESSMKTPEQILPVLTTKINNVSITTDEEYYNEFTTTESLQELQDGITQQPTENTPVSDEVFSNESTESYEFKILETIKEQNYLLNTTENSHYKNSVINTEDPNIKILSSTGSANNQTTQSMNNVSSIDIIDNVDYSNEIDYYEHHGSEIDMDIRQSDESSHEENYNESTTIKEQNYLLNTTENSHYKNSVINTEDPNIKILSSTGSANNQTTQSMNNVSSIDIIDNVDYSNEIDYYEHQGSETDMDIRQSDESSHEENYNESTTTESLQETTTNNLPITIEQNSFTTEISNTSSKNMSTAMDLDVVVPYSNTNILNSLETITNKNSSINMNYADNSPAIDAFENTHNEKTNLKSKPELLSSNAYQFGISPTGNFNILPKEVLFNNEIETKVRRILPTESQKIHNSSKTENNIQDHLMQITTISEDNNYSEEYLDPITQDPKEVLSPVKQLNNEEINNITKLISENYYSRVLLENMTTEAINLDYYEILGTANQTSFINTRNSSQYVIENKKADSENLTKYERVSNKLPDSHIMLNIHELKFQNIVPTDNITVQKIEHNNSEVQKNANSNSTNKENLLGEYAEIQNKTNVFDEKSVADSTKNLKISPISSNVFNISIIPNFGKNEFTLSTNSNKEDTNKSYILEDLVDYNNSLEDGTSSQQNAEHFLKDTNADFMEDNDEDEYIDTESILNINTDSNSIANKQSISTLKLSDILNRSNFDVSKINKNNSLEVTYNPEAQRVHNGNLTPSVDTDPNSENTTVSFKDTISDNIKENMFELEHVFNNPIEFSPINKVPIDVNNVTEKNTFYNSLEDSHEEEDSDVPSVINTDGDYDSNEDTTSETLNILAITDMTNTISNTKQTLDNITNEQILIPKINVSEIVINNATTNFFRDMASDEEVLKKKTELSDSQYGEGNSSVITKVLNESPVGLPTSTVADNSWQFTDIIQTHNITNHDNENTETVTEVVWLTQSSSYQKPSIIIENVPYETSITGPLYKISNDLANTAKVTIVKPEKKSDHLSELIAIIGSSLQETTQTSELPHLNEDKNTNFKGNKNDKESRLQKIQEDVTSTVNCHTGTMSFSIPSSPSLPFTELETEIGSEAGEETKVNNGSALIEKTIGNYKQNIKKWSTFKNNQLNNDSLTKSDNLLMEENANADDGDAVADTDADVNTYVNAASDVDVGNDEGTTIYSNEKNMRLEMKVENKDTIDGKTDKNSDNDRVVENGNNDNGSILQHSTNNHVKTSQDEGGINEMSTIENKLLDISKSESNVMTKTAKSSHDKHEMASNKYNKKDYLNKGNEMIIKNKNHINPNSMSGIKTPNEDDEIDDDEERPNDKTENMFDNLLKTQSFSAMTPYHSNSDSSNTDKNILASAQTKEEITTTNWWHSLPYAEIRKFLNSIFDSVTSTDNIRFNGSDESTVASATAPTTPSPTNASKLKTIKGRKSKKEQWPIWVLNNIWSSLL